LLLSQEFLVALAGFADENVLCKFFPAFDGSRSAGCILFGAHSVPRDNATSEFPLVAAAQRRRKDFTRIELHHSARSVRRLEFCRET
jgi:hypothetical protein